jgi:hypothetical protein
VSDKALLALSITMSAPADAPPCFTLRDDFPEQARGQVEQLLKRTWPLMVWNVDLKGSTQ